MRKLFFPLTFLIVLFTACKKRISAEEAAFMNQEINAVGAALTDKYQDELDTNLRKLYMEFEESGNHPALMENKLKWDSLRQQLPKQLEVLEQIQDEAYNVTGYDPSIDNRDKYNAEVIISQELLEKYNHLSNNNLPPSYDNIILFHQQIHKQRNAVFRKALDFVNEELQHIEEQPIRQYALLEDPGNNQIKITEMKFLPGTLKIYFSGKELTAENRFISIPYGEIHHNGIIDLSLHYKTIAVDTVLNYDLRPQ